MRIDLLHNKIIADTVTEQFETSVRERLVPLVSMIYEDAVGILMYEDYIADDFSRDGLWYYPLTVKRENETSVMWITWRLDKKSFASRSPYSYVGEELLKFGIAEIVPPEFDEAIKGRAHDYDEDAMPITVRATSDDPFILAGGYSQTFVDELASQITKEISRALSLRGLGKSGIELELVFAPATYMEHTSESVTYRRLLLVDGASKPRDFWVKWTRVGGGVAYSVSDAVSAEDIKFELGEDVAHKIREKEYRFLCGSNPNTYQAAMGKRAVTEWRDIIKRAVRRGDVTKVESELSIKEHASDVHDKLTEVLGSLGINEETVTEPVSQSNFDSLMDMVRAALEKSEQAPDDEDEIEIVEPLNESTEVTDAESDEADAVEEVDEEKDGSAENTDEAEEDALDADESEEIGEADEAEEIEEVEETEEIEEAEEIEEVEETEEIEEAEEDEDVEAEEIDEESEESEEDIDGELELDFNEDGELDEDIEIDEDEDDDEDDDGYLKPIEAPLTMEELLRRIEIADAEAAAKLAEAEEKFIDDDDSDEDEADAAVYADTEAKDIDEADDTVEVIAEDEPEAETAEDVDASTEENDEVTVEPEDEEAEDEIIETKDEIIETDDADETHEQEEIAEESAPVIEPKADVPQRSYVDEEAERRIREEMIRREVEAKIRLEYEAEARARAEAEVERLIAESRALREENLRLAKEARDAEEMHARILSDQRERAERARAAEEQLRLELEAKERQEQRERDRLAEAARLAVEEQRQREAEQREAIIRQENERRERAEAERLAKEAEERRLEEERLARIAEEERIRREAEERELEAKRREEAMFISKRAKIIFRHAVDANIITKIREIVEQTIVMNNKQNVRIHMKAYQEDRDVINLDILKMPRAENDLLVAIVKAIGNARIGVIKIILE